MLNEEEVVVYENEWYLIRLQAVVADFVEGGEENGGVAVKKHGRRAEERRKKKKCP